MTVYLYIYKADLGKLLVWERVAVCKYIYMYIYTYTLYIYIYTYIQVFKYVIDTSF